MSRLVSYVTPACSGCLALNVLVRDGADLGLRRHDFGNIRPGIERGDEGPRRTGFPRPLAKSGLDLAIEVQDPGVSISEANLDDGRLYPVALLVSGVPRGRAPRRPSIPIRFPRGFLRPKPLKSPLGLDPVSRPLRSKPPGAFDQRAGPVRFEPRVSPVFRAAVSLGLIKLAPIRGCGKRSGTGCCG